MKLTLVLLMALVAVCMANSGGPFNTSYINGIIESVYMGETYGHGKHLFNECGGMNKADKSVGIPVPFGGANQVIRFPNRGNTVNIQFAYAAWDNDTTADTYGNTDGKTWDVFAHYTLHIQQATFYTYDSDQKIRGGRSHVNLNNFAWDWDECSFAGGVITLNGYRYNLHARVVITIATGSVSFTVLLEQAAPAYSSGNSGNNEERSSEKIDLVNLTQNANTAALVFKLSCDMGDQDDGAVDTSFDTDGNGKCPLVTAASEGSYDFNSIKLSPSSYIKEGIVTALNLGTNLDWTFTITGSAQSAINGNGVGAVSGTDATAYHNPFGRAATGSYRLRANYDDYDIFQATDETWDSDDYSSRYALEILYPPTFVSGATDTIVIFWDPLVCFDKECSYREAKPDALPNAEPEAEPEAKPEAEPEAKPDAKPEAEADPEPEVEFEIPAAIEENSSAVLRATLALVALAAVALF